MEQMEQMQQQMQWANNRMQELRLSMLHSEKTPMELFRLMMQASFIRPGFQKADNFMPCKQDLQLLRLQEGVINKLHEGSLSDFYKALFPHALQGKEWTIRDDKTWEDEVFKAANQSIFYHSGSPKESYMIFKDQMERAGRLAKIIQQMRQDHPAGGPVTLRILDGHGRMLLCILKALVDLQLDPCDDVIQIEVYEIDEEVYEYHEAVFPKCVVNKFQSILDVRLENRTLRRRRASVTDAHRHERAMLHCVCRWS